MLLAEYWIERTGKMLERTADLLRTEIAMLVNEHPEMADDEFLRADMLEGETPLHEVLTEINRMIEDARALRDGTKSRLDDLNQRRARMDRRMEFGRKLIEKILLAADLKRVELPEATISLRNGQRSLIGDGVDLPDEFVKLTRAPDRVKIREALEAGQEVPGYALSNAAPQLTIRVK
jgi:hypothetical protein